MHLDFLQVEEPADESFARLEFLKIRRANRTEELYLDGKSRGSSRGIAVSSSLGSLLRSLYTGVKDIAGYANNEQLALRQLNLKRLGTVQGRREFTKKFRNGVEENGSQFA